MSDNTSLNPAQVGGDVVRDIDRLGAGVKTQVVQLDLGGGSGNAEALIVAGQQAMAASVPVVIASNQSAFPVFGTSANGAAVSGNPMLVAGYDGTTTRTIRTLADGTLVMNGVQDVRSAGTVTTATSVVGPISVVNRNVVTFSMYGTYAGVTINLEATDDGTNWYGLQSINNSTGQAGYVWVLASNALISFDAAVGGYISVRVRASAWTSGTLNVGVNPQVFAYEPVIASMTQGLSASASALLGNPVLNGFTFTTTLPTVTTGQVVNAQSTARGEQLVALSNGAVAVAHKAASTAAVAADPALVVSLSPNSPITLPTPSTSIINSAATTNATSVKASAGTVYSVTASNTGAAVAYVKLYNLATAPTVGTSTIAITIAVPAGGTVNLPFGTSGARFATGIGLSITNLGTDADATAVTAAQVKVITSYI